MSIYHIIVNSASVSGRNALCLDTVKSVFDRAGRAFEIHMTQYRGHAREVAAESTSSGDCCTLIAMGGDGTLHETLNGVAYPEKCNLGLIPLGTGNDFAAAIHLPDDVKYAAQIIAFKTPELIDYIQLSDGLRSINAVGTGLDCDILRRAYRSKSNGKLKYLRACISSLLHFRSYPFAAELDGATSEPFGMLACLGNGRQIGGGIKLFPDYSLNDGLMEVVMVDSVSRLRALAEFVKLMRGKLKSNDRIIITKAKHVKIVNHSKNYTVQAEGELYENIPLDAQIVTGKLHFYMP